MGEVVKPEHFISCSICHKRQAKLLCDMPISRTKNLHLKLPNGLTDYENSFKEYTSTCDRAICEKCAVEVGDGLHFCKKCISELKEKI